MDDVTVDVNQYSEEDSVILSSKPNFAMASTTIELPSNKEEIEEDYELKPEDAPAFSTKFEIPDEKPEELEEPTNEPIALIQPTSGTPDNVQVMEAQNISENIDDIEILQPADFDGDGNGDVDGVDGGVFRVTTRMIWPSIRDFTGVASRRLRPLGASECE